MTLRAGQTRIFIALVPELRQRIFPGEIAGELRALAEVESHDAASNLTGPQLAAILGDFDAVITGWGTPPFDDSVLAARGRLRIVAHSAGSIKHLFPPPLFEAGIAVTHAAAAIAPAVAEMCLTLTLALLRRVPQYIGAMKAGQSWEEALAIGYGTELASARVGVVGAGHTGRCFIKLLRGLEGDICVFDPYLSSKEAADLGARKVELDELLSTSQVVALHAPSTPKTRHMIGAKQLSMLKDGAIFINTARSWLVDEAALLEELRRRRIVAALDVFDQEPLAADSPFRSLPNVYLLPHVAGGSQQTAARQGRLIVDELRRFFGGEALKYPVRLDMLQTMA
jgi:phosphoglycerate dehydrogenase-like enzyme